MTTIDIDEFKERLLDERHRLKDAIDNIHSEHGASLEDETGDLSSFEDNHLADVASDTFDRELDEGLEEGAGRRLEQIDVALRRIDEGTYGTCEECGKPIPVERLRAVPWATLCIDDQRKREQG